MSDYTYRVFLSNNAHEWASDGSVIYVSDDNAGSERLYELHQKYGNLNMELCQKEFGKSLDEARPVWKGTIEQNEAGEGIYLDDNGNPTDWS